MIIPLTDEIKLAAQAMAERRAKNAIVHKRKAVFDHEGTNETDGMIKKQYIGCLGEIATANALGWRYLDREGGDPGYDVVDDRGITYQVQTSGRHTHNNRELKVPVAKNVHADYLIQLRELGDDFLELVGIIPYRAWVAFREYWIPPGDKGLFPCDVKQGDDHIRCRTFIVQPEDLQPMEEFLEAREALSRVGE